MRTSSASTTPRSGIALLPCVPKALRATFLTRPRKSRTSSLSVAVVDVDVDAVDSDTEAAVGPAGADAEVTHSAITMVTMATMATEAIRDLTLLQPVRRVLPGPLPLPTDTPASGRRLISAAG